MNSETGKWILIIGLIVAAIGILVYFFHEKLKWFGHLPGDIRIERENFRLYFPITTMIIVSIIVSIIIQLIRKL